MTTPFQWDPKTVNGAFRAAVIEITRVHQWLTLVSEQPLAMPCDSVALNRILTDLSWAIEDCTVMALHQIGENLDDTMGIPEAEG